MADRARRPRPPLLRGQGRGDPATFAGTTRDSGVRGNDGIPRGRFRALLDPSARVLAKAIVVSLALHLTIVALPQPTVSAPEAMPILSATITEMPPPPAPVKLPPVKRKAKPA